jgi:hypothetical protein
VTSQWVNPWTLEKRCSRCFRSLPVPEFRPNEKLRSGLDSWCLVHSSRCLARPHARPPCGSPEELDRFRVVKLGERVQAHRMDRIRLPVAKQPFQGLDTGVSVAVPKLSERRCGERDLREWWQSLVDESLEPSQRRSLVAGRIDVRQELAQRERVGE